MAPAASAVPTTFAPAISVGLSTAAAAPGAAAATHAALAAATAISVASAASTPAAVALASVALATVALATISRFPAAPMIIAVSSGSRTVATATVSASTPGEAGLRCQE
ncbi:hypothetical protein [Microvirga yunnanensis]|uniref:hypothetical protein n=1 Tax=Microvirga yunnanensis TaxID=2953740 RepID=UPI0021C96C11|nr:hypothetical protein [Microvirga sp. HBU65207]